MGDDSRSSEADTDFAASVEGRVKVISVVIDMLPDLKLHKDSLLHPCIAYTVVGYINLSIAWSIC